LPVLMLLLLFLPELSFVRGKEFRVMRNQSFQVLTFALMT
jgi:hypothetical protein